MARTDARAVEGFDRAVERAHLYEQAGADVIFVEAPESIDELERPPQLIRAPLLINIACLLRIHVNYWICKRILIAISALSGLRPRLVGSAFG